MYQIKHHLERDVCVKHNLKHKILENYGKGIINIHLYKPDH